MKSQAFLAKLDENLQKAMKQSYSAVAQDVRGS
jgi:hypothetical protein